MTMGQAFRAQWMPMLIGILTYEYSMQEIHAANMPYWILVTPSSMLCARLAIKCIHNCNIIYANYAL